MTDSTQPEYLPIEDYGLIGDLRTAALVGTNGSIDFLCYPRFDSPSVFCANADAVKGGRFQIVPQLNGARTFRMYVPDTNVLITRFQSADGIAEISDFMWIGQGCESPTIVRRAKAVHGTVRFRMLCQPRFNYARGDHSLSLSANRRTAVFEPIDDSISALGLNSEIELSADGDDVDFEFALNPGETAAFAFGAAEADSFPQTADPGFAARAFKDTCDYWRGWISQCRYRGHWRAEVHRSALALKLLTCREHGSIVAAPCFGFPNEIGGERNWDYRFTWLRDASFTVYGLMRLGFTEEAGDFVNWLERRIDETDEEGRLQTMYQLNGEQVAGEEHLDHLSGYRGSRPVRIGSTNHDQMQLDIYGELLDSIYLYDKFGTPVSHDLWRGVRRLVNFVMQHWREPDAGIWEVRGGDHEFLYSRVMCWVALDRALRLAHKRGLPAPVTEWRRARDEIYESVFAEFYHPKRKAFTQFKGSDSLDASALIMPLVRIVSPTDPRWLATLKAIENDLVEDSRVYRYRVGEAFSDELAGGEGTFSICSFWLIECISRSGDLQRARFLFEKMLSYGNSLSLFSEQVGSGGEFLGNVPQAFTHLSLISAAYDLDRRLSADRHREVGGGAG